MRSLARRISEIWDRDNALLGDRLDGTRLGGGRKNLSNHARTDLGGHRLTGKAVVMGARGRATKQVAARAVGFTDKETMRRSVGRILADCF